MVTIEIDDKKVEARQGQMIIEAADQIGIQIPRFCYHKKLSIAANCRMCLVDVDKAPKPLPACATPVSDGMKIYTRTPRALDAQKAVMEFLLINHPLDCPICDQGGQCELQDLALEYGKDSSRFEERKRVVKDKNIGPLISTEMTRCIHCTRCVRFGSEIAGERELGATGRGEFMQIGTYVEKSVNSEMSGNVIDLCPVGALTSKPFRFKARAWEITSKPSISPHDCIGSHLFFHVQDNKVLRALPKENEALNEVWLSDRDRFSYEALNHPQRLGYPLIKREGSWKKVDWPTALSFAVEKLQNIIQKDTASQLGIVASSNCSLEEFYLLQKLFKDQGCYNVDHRLRQMDNKHQSHLGIFPTLGISLTDLEQQQNILIIGSDIKKEQPLINHRIRKATSHGAQVFIINPLEVALNYTPLINLIPPKGNIIQALMEVVKAAIELSDKEVIADCPVDLLGQLNDIQPSSAASDMAKHLMQKQKASIILGGYVLSHPQAHQLYWLARTLAHLCNATFGEMSEGANSAGGWLAGCVPHRFPFGKEDLAKTGLSAYEMFKEPRQGYVIVGFEPHFDCVAPKFATAALKAANTVVVLTAFDSPELREYADVILPITPISEMAGTYINAFGEWASVEAAVDPFEQSRPAWKVLRVMANLWEIPGFDYQIIEDVLTELQTLRKPPFSDSLLSMNCKLMLEENSKLVRLAPVGLYQVDGIVRRADALQQTQDAKMSMVKLNSQEAQNRGLKADQKVWVIEENAKSFMPMPIEIDDRLPTGVALVASGIQETQSLGAPFAQIELKAAE
ncbi:MAG: NADH-quinone oxidoreductase subunit G [Proteobacteria bacterium]|nr:NADH-quinone oxidoreductase subunit G [Pseudomonadota bacterium]